MLSAVMAQGRVWKIFNYERHYFILIKTDDDTIFYAHMNSLDGGQATLNALRPGDLVTFEEKVREHWHEHKTAINVRYQGKHRPIADDPTLAEGAA